MDFWVELANRELVEKIKLLLVDAPAGPQSDYIINDFRWVSETRLGVGHSNTLADIFLFLHPHLSEMESASVKKQFIAGLQGMASRTRKDWKKESCQHAIEMIKRGETILDSWAKLSEVGKVTLS
ncbi:MAG: hypothetical protein AB7G93_15275 [Bdellovibrionales bacterium]